MKTYEEAERIWGARKADLRDDAEGISVNFEFEAWSVAGCDTCGPETSKEFTVQVRQKMSPQSYGTIVFQDSYDVEYSDTAFKEILKEILEVASE